MTTKKSATKKRTTKKSTTKKATKRPSTKKPAAKKTTKKPTTKKSATKKATKKRTATKAAGNRTGKVALNKAGIRALSVLARRKGRVSAADLGAAANVHPSMIGNVCGCIDPTKRVPNLASEGLAKLEIIDGIRHYSATAKGRAAAAKMK